MKVQELMEGISSKVYHVTGIKSALEILKNKEFRLSSAVDTRSPEIKFQKGKPYFLSVSRNPANDYNMNNAYRSVMFNLNGDWFAQRYKGTPVDYWERMWLATNRTSEQEDRILSSTPSIKIPDLSKVIEEIHILIKDTDSKTDDFLSPIWSNARKVAIIAKQNNIPVYFYQDMNAYITQDTRKSLDLKNLDVKVTNKSTRTTRRYDYLAAWIELYHKKDKSELSPRADKLRYNLIYSYDDNADMGLSNDLNNSRKSNSLGYNEANTLIKLMKNQTPIQFAQMLKNKWKNLNETTAGAVAAVATPLGGIIHRIGHGTKKSKKHK
jgi:hypothetical protein